MEREIGQLREFGKFRLDVARKVLWFEDNPVDLPLKEIELLCVLTEKSGELSTKDELLDRVWPGAFVEESNLSRHIYLIRQTFKQLGEGEDWIHTVARRGYRFDGEVRVIGADVDSLVIEKHSFTRTLMEEVSDETHSNPHMSLVSLRAQTPKFRVGVALGAVFAVVCALGGFAYYGNRKVRTVSAHNIKSLAVLPFKTLAANGANEHEGIGIADIVITRLSVIQAVTVRPTSAVMAFENTEQDSVAIGKQLSVDAVLEGSIYRSGDKTRVTARLINVSDQKLIWSSQFERVKAEELQLHDEIALELANALSLNLSDEERRAVTKRYTENKDAYQLYLKGRYHWNKRSNEGLIEAENLFRKAIERDPTFAPAYVGLADSQMFTPVPSAELYSVLAKAIELDPNLGEAYASMGFLLSIHDWRWREAEESFKKSIKLNHGYATAHHWYATLLGIEGRYDEAKAELNRALEINPVSYNFLADLGQVYYFNHEYDQAKEYCQKALAIYPEFSYAHMYLSNIYWQTGNYEDAIGESGQALMNMNKVGTDASLTDEEKAIYIAKLKEPYHRGGIKGYLKASVAPDNNHQPNVQYGNALLFSLLEDEENALRSLEQALIRKSFLMPWVKAEPTFDRLRSSPRFKAILQKLNLPPDV